MYNDNDLAILHSPQKSSADASETKAQRNILGSGISVNIDENDALKVADFERNEPGNPSHEARAFSQDLRICKDELTSIPHQSLMDNPEVAKAIEAKQRKLRFLKIGDNANHPLTTEMRVIKAALRLTTKQLVQELNKYEKQYQSHNFHKSEDPRLPNWLPMTPILMASYLQGWVAQESFMKLMTQRLENLYRHKLQTGEVVGSKDIRSIMDGWYATLGIDQNDPNISPTRMLAKLIAPFYKRPVLAAVSGIFKLGMPVEDGQLFEITDSHGTTHTFTLNKDEPVLVKDGQKLNVRDVIQYSVLMTKHKKGDQIIVTHEPCVNHTTFYRWYSNNKMPRSIKTIELVQAAVDEAARVQKAASGKKVKR